MSGRCVLFTWGLENWKQASKHGGQICILCSRWWRSERWAAVDRGVTTGYARTMAGSIGRQSTLWGLRKAGRHFGFCNPGRGTRYGGAVCCMDQGVSGWGGRVGGDDGQVGGGGGVLSRR